MSAPYVSCIMPTANRPNFALLAIEHFLNQDFRDAELIIIDDGKKSIRSLLPGHHRIKYFYTDPLGSVGVKRNFACEKAQGEIIMHWDDDDWYAHDWISRSIKSLNESKADITGLSQITFFSPRADKFWWYDGNALEHPWLAGATMTYRKSFWLTHPFRNLQIGEDYDYSWNTGAQLHAHNYTDGFIATVHNSNTTLKPFEDPRHKREYASNWMDVHFEGKTENPKQSRYYH